MVEGPTLAGIVQMTIQHLRVAYLLPFLLGTADGVQQRFSFWRRDELVNQEQLVAPGNTVVCNVHKTEAAKIILCGGVK